MTDFRIRVIIDPGPAVAGGKKVERQLKQTKGAADRLGAKLLTVFAGVGLASALIRSVRLLANFAQEMSTVAAVTGATAEQFKQLTDEAQRLGRTTRFTATQAAEGMAFLARAGFTAEESLEAVGGTLKLAQAGALELGRAADIASNVLVGFRLEVNQTGRVVDVLALAAISANTTVNQLGEAMKFVAPIAAGVGVSVEESAAAISALSDAGLQGSLAGTGLRRVLAELESPAAKTTQLLKDLGLTTDDVKVSQVGLTSALSALREAGVTTGQALEIFGQRGGPAFEVLSTSIPKVIELNKELDNAGGTADRVSAVMDDNLNGALLRVVSAFQGFILAAGDSGGFTVLTGSAEKVAIAFNFMTDNIDGVGAALTVLGVTLILTKTALVATAAASGAATFAWITQTVAATALAFTLGGLGSVLTGVALGMRRIALISIANPFVLVAAGAVGAFLVISKLEEALKRINTANEIAAGREFSGLSEFGKVGLQISKTQELVDRYKESIAGDISKGLAPSSGVLGALGRAELKLGGLIAKQKAMVDSSDSATAAAKDLADATNRMNLAFNRTKSTLENDARLLGLSNKEREVQTSLLTVLADIEKEGGPELTNGEEDALVALIRRNQALKDQSEILDTIRGPNERFIRDLGALQMLLDEDKITLDEFNMALTGLAQASDDIDLSTLELPEGLSGDLDLTGHISQIQELIAAETERIRVQQLRSKILQDILGPEAELIESQTILKQLLEDGSLTNTQYAEALREINNQLNPMTEAQKMQAEVLDQIKGPQEDLMMRTAALNALFAEGKITLDEYTQAMSELPAKTAEAGDGFGDGFTRGLKQLDDSVGSTADQVESLMVSSFNKSADALAEFAMKGKLDFKEFAMSIIADIVRMIAQQLLLNAIQGATKGIIGAASGGPFEANDSMIVGEKGPEIVQFGQPGQITPANKTAEALGTAGGGGGTTVVQAPAPDVNISVVNVDSPEAARSAMDTDDGGQIIMNQIRKNRGAIKRDLG